MLDVNNNIIIKIIYLPESMCLPMATSTSSSVPLKPYCSNSRMASMLSGTRSKHSCNTHDRLVILLCNA